MRALRYRSLVLPLRPQQQHRAFSRCGVHRADDAKAGREGVNRPNPVLEEYQRKYADRPAAPQAAQAAAARRTGDLGASSIFEDDRRAHMHAEPDAADGDGGLEVGGEARDPRNMLRVLDPNPGARERWEKKKVIQMVRKGGRLSKAQFIKRTEREHLARSHNMKTSVKKLGMLARQIAGKNIDDAITQMRFSKKKIATEVMKQLQFARDEAVVMRGMGMGAVETEEGAENLNETSLEVSGTTTPESEITDKKTPIEIQLKDGKRHRVTDRSKIYIDQAWVGRGPYGRLPDHRARGAIYIMRTPWTSLSVILKEEATRIREYEDREAKRTRQRLKKVWVPLLDRPISTQSQWYSW